MRVGVACVCLAVAAAATLAPGGPAAADVARRAKVAVLGVHAAPEHAGFAADLTGTVRWAAEKTRAWDLLRGAPDDVQGAIARGGCAALDEPCLAAIAAALGADGLVFGRATRNRGTRWAVGLYYYDARQARVTRSTTDAFPLVAADVDALRPRAAKWVEALAVRAR